jgi:hypothetical protein
MTKPEPSLLRLVVIGSAAEQLEKLPVQQWITTIIGSAKEAGAVQALSGGFYTVTLSYFDLPGLASRIGLAGLDGMWHGAPREELDPVFENTRGVLMLADRDAQWPDRLSQLLKLSKVIRVIAHRSDTPPATKHDRLVHGDWTTREGALAAMKQAVVLMLKRVEGNA